MSSAKVCTPSSLELIVLSPGDSSDTQNLGFRHKTHALSDIARTCAMGAMLTETTSCMQQLYLLINTCDAHADTSAI